MDDAAGSRPDGDNPGGADGGPRVARVRPATPRHAASLILWRHGRAGPEVLMGLRHARHRFMPNVLVFPGGRVDRADFFAREAESELPDATRAALERAAPPRLARALAVAAARELEEETGLVLGRMAGKRLRPALGGMDYLCRALTPPGSRIRFNARFLVARAEAATGTIRGSGELETLRFFALDEARTARVASITGKVLGEFTAWLALPAAERATRPLVRYLGMDNRVAERKAR